MRSAPCGGHTRVASSTVSRTSPLRGRMAVSPAAAAKDSEPAGSQVRHYVYAYTVGWYYCRYTAKFKKSWMPSSDDSQEVASSSSADAPVPPPLRPGVRRALRTALFREMGALRARRRRGTRQRHSQSTCDLEEQTGSASS